MKSRCLWSKLRRGTRTEDSRSSGDYSQTHLLLRALSFRKGGFTFCILPLRPLKQPEWVILVCDGSYVPSIAGVVKELVKKCHDYYVDGNTGNHNELEGILSFRVYYEKQKVFRGCMEWRLRFLCQNSTIESLIGTASCAWNVFLLVVNRNSLHILLPYHRHILDNNTIS